MLEMGKRTAERTASQATVSEKSVRSTSAWVLSGNRFIQLSALARKYRRLPLG